MRGCSLKTEEREPKASAGGISAFTCRDVDCQEHSNRRLASPLEVLVAVDAEEPLRFDSLISWEDLRVDSEVSMESLILAQDERWRRA